MHTDKYSDKKWMCHKAMHYILSTYFLPGYKIPSRLIFFLDLIRSARFTLASCYILPTQNRDSIFDPISIHILPCCPKLQFHAIQDLGMRLSYSILSEQFIFHDPAEYWYRADNLRWITRWHLFLIGGKLSSGWTMFSEKCLT